MKHQYSFLHESESRLITFGRSKDDDENEVSEQRKRKIGISFNGRQFPGGHNIIQGLLSENTEVIGFLGGNKGIF